MQINLPGRTGGWRERIPQRIGLSQFKEVETPVEKKEASIKNKNVKLSDLLRRDSSVISVSDVNI